ncbi:hypothetical protein TRFO_07046 [Tritrichomonas foetus]|uniref:Uncharacterized protein n=1 Tax=Tritrichomonas foetus TaxID=1144522 RepID=A0A1J4JW08_9EUKA|nr:hypothetical protein TRFO_07046 [Tritrichomonas foetus]|eukprot:OHT02624.1 hypothetical protein TRFO_07046 [Tritrichomonas foetus]
MFNVKHLKELTIFSPFSICKRFYQKMISKEEFAILQQKLVQISKKKEEYEVLISERKQEIEEMKHFQQKIDSLESAIEADEESQNRELSEASAEVKNFRPDSSSRWNIFDREQKKIPKLESTLASHEEKLEKLIKLGVEMQEADHENEEKINPLLAEAKEIEKQLSKLERLSTRIPPAAPIMLKLDELERENVFLVDSNKLALTKLPEMSQKVEELEEKIQLNEAQLNRYLLELNSIQLEIEQQKTAKNEQFVQLQEVSTELTHVNQEMRNENTTCSHEHSLSEKQEISQQSELTELRKQIIEFKHDVETFPEQIKIAHNDNATLLYKKKQMSEQLEKKLVEIRQEMIQKQSNTEEVQQLTSKLEQHWLQHQKIFDAHEKKKALLEKKRDELQRKKIAYEEINNRWPIHGKVKAKIGLSELNYIYEEAMIQNRKMALDLNTLKDDLVVQEEMNATLKANLMTNP